MTDRGEQSAEVMDATEEDTTDQNPQGASQPAETSASGVDGASDGACASDGGEVVTHQNGCGCGDIVDVITQGVCRSGFLGLANAPLLAQPTAIEDIADHQDSDANEQKCDTGH